METGMVQFRSTCKCVKLSVNTGSRLHHACGSYAPLRIGCVACMHGDVVGSSMVYA